MAVIKLLSVEAIGDTFAQLSGVWIDNARVARHVAAAGKVWAFAAEDMEQAIMAAGTAECPDTERIIGLIPGAHPAWPEDEGRRQLSRMLGEEALDGCVGLLLAVAAPDCGNCPGKQCNKAGH